MCIYIYTYIYIYMYFGLEHGHSCHGPFLRHILALAHIDVDY